MITKKFWKRASLVYSCNIKSKELITPLEKRTISNDLEKVKTLNILATLFNTCLSLEIYVIYTKYLKIPKF